VITTATAVPTKVSSTPAANVDQSPLNSVMVATTTAMV
jgi:hypothetical protein